MCPEEAMQPRILVLGLGNILLQDDGLGVRTLEQLKARYRLPQEVQVMDGGVLGLDLLPYLDKVAGLLIIDAVRTGQPPGSLVRLEDESISAALALKVSSHQVGLQELLATSHFLGTLPPRVVLWGMEPTALEWSVDLSPLVETLLDDLVDAVAQELRDWGVSVEHV
jgi:hydrogenase maturation protease